jgi:Lrp/AsnC family leucine-responsive transcriptional regulator
MDDTDWRILVELQNDGRLSHSELGRRIGLSQPATAERVRRLEEAGVIEGYHATVSLEKVGRPLGAIVRLAARTGQGGPLAALVEELPEVLECHHITGDDCYTIRVAVASVRELEKLLERFTPHGQTTTSIILSSPVTCRVVEPKSAERPRIERQRAS